MLAPRFYCPMPLSVGLRFDLAPEVAKHACRVLRLRTGDDLLLFNGHGGEYSARIAELDRERVSVDVLGWSDTECEAPINVKLVQALQAGEKMDMTVQKAVELGVASIVPVISRRSVVRLNGERATRRVEHWRGVASAACEQCGRNRVPEVVALEALDQWLAKSVGKGVLRLMLAPGSAQTLDSIAPPAPGGQVELLIGAEGVLAAEEMERAAMAGFISVRLGPRILRTETAGLATLAAIQCLWGDFRKGADHV
ncbi:MAG: 16S rRNA (uracil(1498)-N(3))-methyltransferase [Propionivibrio sp.]|uniref:Ribosomal RNA small subunit methyltransferase E n=1 Tax=Candidatus Propionivibrio dominans TaxID=2954373 RepID=A0A9D7ICQ2_9RHOO|nr:16S rRNA (uracil(1498)-N(3))-methyltransferase [Candidatus Propionivibrio dominans]